VKKVLVLFLLVVFAAALCTTSYAAYGDIGKVNLPLSKREEITSLSSEDCKVYKK
jgi:hypothetical protein